MEYTICGCYAPHVTSKNPTLPSMSGAIGGGIKGRDVAFIGDVVTFPTDGMDGDGALHRVATANATAGHALNRRFRYNRSWKGLE